MNTHFENIGRSYFPTMGETLDVGFGKEVRVVVRGSTILKKAASVGRQFKAGLECCIIVH